MLQAGVCLDEGGEQDEGTEGINFNLINEPSYSLVTVTSVTQGRWPSGNDRRTLQLNKQNCLSGMESKTIKANPEVLLFARVAWPEDKITGMHKTSTKAPLKLWHVAFILFSYSCCNLFFPQPLHCHFVCTVSHAKYKMQFSEEEVLGKWLTKSL